MKKDQVFSTVHKQYLKRLAGQIFSRQIKDWKREVTDLWVAIDNLTFVVKKMSEYIKNNKKLKVDNKNSEGQNNTQGVALNTRKRKEKINLIEVAAPEQKLVLSQRFGTNLVQLIWDVETKAYYLHYCHHGKQLLYEFVSDDLDEAIFIYNDYLQNSRKVFH